MSVRPVGWHTDLQWRIQLLVNHAFIWQNYELCSLMTLVLPVLLSIQEHLVVNNWQYKLVTVSEDLLNEIYS